MLSPSPDLSPSESSRNSDELLIDDEPVSYGRLFDGSLLLPENAYEWGDDLLELAERLIDYRDKTQEVRRRNGSEV